MSSTPNPYAPVAKRDLRQALIHHLETEYKILGSHRVLEMIATDILALVEEYYPLRERVKAGEILWTTTADTGRKPGRGQKVEDCPQVTLCLPWVTAEDLTLPSPGGQRGFRQRDIARAVRLVKAARAAGGLLTLAELGALFNVSPATVQVWLDEHYQRTGEVLPTKGQVMDIGSQPSHKDVVIYLLEQKVDSIEIARRTHHQQSSVDRYIRDYERVKLLMSKGMSPAEISHATGRALHTVRQYCRLVEYYHPELCPTSEGKTVSNPVQP